MTSSASGAIPNPPLRQPSETALTAAAARAAHLIVDRKPFIFADTLAGRLLGDRADTLLSYHRAHATHPVLAGARTQVIVRSRYAESRVARGIDRGIDQYVILGAGLDSFAYRSPLARRVRVFEVDHPATQHWKRNSLSAAGMSIGDRVTFVAVDFETDALLGRLVHSGFDSRRPAIVAWLGVTMYLRREAIVATLEALGSLADGTEVVLDYMLPADVRDEAGSLYVELVAPVAAQHGEPWLTNLSHLETTDLLRAAGFGDVESLRQRDAIDAPLWSRDDGLAPVELSAIARATLHTGR